MDTNSLNLSISFLGIIASILAVGLVFCLMATVGYNLYIKYKDKHKEIEVHSKKNSNSKKNKK